MPGKRAADAQAEAAAGAGGGAKQARTEEDRRGGGAPEAAEGTAGTENIVLINSTDGIDQWISQNKFLGLLQSRTAIDIVFESSSNKQTLEAHRLVLAMQSPKLKELISSDLFFQPGNGNGRMSFVSMSNPVHFEALSVILDWIYKVRAHSPLRASLALAGAPGRAAAAPRAGSPSRLMPPAHAALLTCAGAQGKCTLPRDGDIGRTALEFSYMWGMDQIKRCLEAHGFVHLTPKSCARCLLNAYKKFQGSDWEKHGKVVATSLLL